MGAMMAIRSKPVKRPPERGANLTDCDSILAALATKRNCPPDDIPTAERIADWLPEFRAWGDLWERCKRIVSSAGSPLAESARESAMATARECGLVVTAEFLSLNPQWPEIVPMARMYGSVFTLPDGQTSRGGYIWHSSATEWTAAQVRQDCENLHTAWLRVREAEPNRAARAKITHPVELIVDGYLRRPVPVEWNLDDKGIIQGSIFGDHALPGARADDGALFDFDTEFYAESGVDDGQATLPLDIESGRSPFVSLSTQLGLNQGGNRRGARPAKRLLYDLTTAIRQAAIQPGRVHSFEVPLGYLTAGLWPNVDGKCRKTRKCVGECRCPDTYRPYEQGAYLISELDVLSNTKIPMPGTRQLFRLIVVRVDPNPYDRSSRARFDIWIPEGLVNGPSVHRGMLARQGAISDPAFNLQIELCYVWDEAKSRNRGYNGNGLRVYARRERYRRNDDDYLVDGLGKLILVPDGRGGLRPTRNPRRKGAIREGGWEPSPPDIRKCVDLLSPDRLLDMAYPTQWKLTRRPQPLAKQERYRRLKDIRKILNGLEATGYVKCEWHYTERSPNKQHVRVLERHKLDPERHLGRIYSLRRAEGLLLL